MLTQYFMISHTMYVINAKLILNDPESSSQDEIQTSHLQDGLRILARIIARDLLARRSAHAKKPDVKADDTEFQRIVDESLH
jgi:hypothetical protein